jgi:hypothetical protein
MGLSPAPRFSESADPVYERQVAPDIAGNRGPLRFEEGIATDTDVPDDFVRGLREPAIPAGGRPNHVDPATQYKHADETMRERAHVGSAAWPDAPSVVAEFAHGAHNANAEITYEEVTRGGSRQARRNPTVILS